MIRKSLFICLVSVVSLSCSQVEYVVPDAFSSSFDNGGGIAPAQKLEWDLRQQVAGSLATQDAIFNAGSWQLSADSIAESGSVNISGTIDQGVVVQVQTRQSYVDPVVVAYVGTRRSDRSVDVRVQNVQSNSFEVFLERSTPNAEAADELVSYLVVEKGLHDLNGMVLHAGLHTTTAFHRGTNNHSGEEVPFSRVFTNKPVVLTTLNSNRNGDFLSSSVNTVTNGSFYIMRETAETGTPLTASEDIAWVALEEQDYSWSGGRVVSAIESDGRDNGIEDTPTAISYSGFNAIPDLVVSMQSTNGNNGGWARAETAASLTGATVVTEEDRVRDSERHHINEEFGWAAFSKDLSISKYKSTGTVTSDPIDLSNLKYYVFANLVEPGTSDVSVSSRLSNDGGVTWSTWNPIQNNVISGLAQGDSTDGVSLQLRVVLRSSFFSTTPRVSDMSLEIQGSNSPQ